MDLSDCIASVSERRMVDIERARPSEIIKGIAQSPSTTSFSTIMSFQPMSQKDLQLLPEGMRNSGAIKGYTATELFTVQTSTCKVPDKIVFENVSYQVQTVDNWSIANYFKIIAVRLGQ